MHMVFYLIKKEYFFLLQSGADLEPLYIRGPGRLPTRFIPCSQPWKEHRKREQRADENIWR